MDKIKLAIIDDSEEVRETLKEYFETTENFTVVGEAADGAAGVKLIDTVKPDAVILDLIMPGLDGFGVLQELKGRKERPKILILSALSQDHFIERAMNFGADYYMLKPYDIFTLRDRLLSIAIRDKFSVENGGANREPDAVRERTLEAARKNRTKSIDEKLSNIFITVGIPAHIKGYQFLREAIKMAIESPEIINSITKRLYPEVAVKFDTSSSKVERAIRHAIEVAWNRGKIENINNVFGIRVYSSHEKPTNGEFIALVADKMLIEGA